VSEENSILRKEIKYRIPLNKALIIKNCLDKLLQRDAHGVGGIYSVRSLYFDSINNKDFSEKLSGTENRKKVRIRIYNGDSSPCKLELKRKKGEYQCKQSLLISELDAKAIMQGNFDILKKYFIYSETSVNIYKIMEVGGYRPVALIEYDRTAYKHSLYDTRITLDMNIRSSESNFDLFSSKTIYTPTEYENVILEVKYSGKMLRYISDILVQFDLNQYTYSKYCTGRRIYYDFNY
jgi:VTC domain.